MAGQKEYTGTCYLTVVGPDSDISICRDSIDAIYKRAGDVGPIPLRATKGYEARQQHLHNFYYNTKHDFILLLDHDQTYQNTTLEQLRQHKLPYVSGFYMRRTFAPVYPVWYYHSPAWPQTPFADIPEKGKLYDLGGSGWGCILLHRDVLTATLPILKGEDWCIEDDMDIWPYNLGVVMGALAGLRELVDTKARVSVLRPALAQLTKTLTDEIRPLRGNKNVVGSDLRFPWYARAAGFPLIGDPAVRCGHVVRYPITPNDFESTPEEPAAELRKQLSESLMEQRKDIQAGLDKLGRVD